MSSHRWRSLRPLLVIALTCSAVVATAQTPKRHFQASAIEAISKPTSNSQKYQRRAKLTSVIVKFDTDSVAAAAGVTLNASSLRQIDMKSAAATKQVSLLAEKRRVFQSAAARAVPSAKMVHDLSVVIGGVSMVVREDEVDALKHLPGVKRVYRDELLKLDTDRSPHFIGADDLFQLGNVGRGQGVVVGMLDTGVWPEHPSFSDPDPNGKPYPAPPASWHGAPCEFGSSVAGDVPFTCNHKLIGARRFMTTYDAVVGLTPKEFKSARDDGGHGTHTASTAAGNNNVSASILGIPRGKVSGIAPRAHVVAYKVCGNDGCFSSDSAAAVQQAILDGVNVINFSISGGSNPYTDAVSLAFLDAYNAGVFVAASAGNSGPDLDTTEHREPWVTTVAASTENRQFQSKLTMKGSNGDTVTVAGASVTPGISSFTSVVKASDAPASDPLCQSATPDNAFAGKIVLCQRGVNARVEKSFNVKQRGAVGMILYNATPLGLATDNHFVPSVHLENTEGTTVLNFFAAHTGVTASFTQGQAVPAQGDVMADFSSRGGPGQTLGISKPDVSAPGVEILAGNTPLPATLEAGVPGELFQAIQGTSMSSPHVAGAAALLKGLHPDWTAGQIKSALMLTAKRKVVKEDGVTPSTQFDRGSGRIQVDDADNPGISISATGADFVDNQANLAAANYPSLYVPAHPGIITVQRTIHSETFWFRVWSVSHSEPSDVKVKVTPEVFFLPAGRDVTISISIDASRVPIGETRFANLHLSSGSYDANVPISFVRRDAPITFAKACVPTSIKLGSDTNCSISLTNTTFEPASVSVVDQLPLQLRLLSVTGGTFVNSSRLTFDGVLAPAQPPDVTIAAGTSPAGYLPLVDFGVAPVSGMDDETIVNFNVPAFTYAGEVYTRIGVTSNGYAIVGGGTGADVDFVNQNLPDPTPPNNVLAPFWTDLNVATGGNVRVGTLTDGADSWVVIEWEKVKTFSGSSTNSFQIWIGQNGDAHPGEDITFTYGPVGDGDGGFLTVGAENRFGNRGQNRYVDGVGIPPVEGTELRVSSTSPVPGETRVIHFTARGQVKGNWTNCAKANSPEIFFGTATACVSGEVTK